MDQNVFFTEAGRGEILHNLLEDINKRKALIKLIGQEGSGKTLVCKLITHNLPQKYESIYLDNPLGSFEDLMRMIGQRLGMNLEDTSGPVDLTVEFSKQLSDRFHQGASVLIIIDEADKLYLATLERLIRLLCEIEETGALQIVLSGNPGLDANLDKLSFYCSNIDIKNGYLLAPLNREDTSAYLRYRQLLAKMDNKEQLELFTDGAVDRIYEEAQGKILLINVLAEKSLQNAYKQRSSQVQAEHVPSGDNKDKQSSKKITFRIPEESETKPLPLVINQLKRIPSLFKSRFFQQNKILLNIGFGFLAALLFVVIFSVEKDKNQTEKPKPTITKESQVKIEVKDETHELLDTVKEEKGPGVSPLPAAEKVEQQQADIEKENKIELEFQKKDLPSKETRNADSIFKDRLRSTATWLAGSYKGAYTIQLMVLVSNQAEENLKKMLIQDEYYQEKDKLYIIRKKSSPPTLFVFYGSYDTSKKAREVRNNLPVILRKHHPYILSISDALKKIED